jgi:signal transduction histidine kinase
MSACWCLRRRGSPKFPHLEADNLWLPSYSPQHMTSGSSVSIQVLGAKATSEILGPRERLEFEHLLQWLRLSFLLMPVLMLLTFGAPAVPYAVGIAAAVAASFSWVGLLARYRPVSLLRHQVRLRVVDCGLVYLILTNYHAFLHNAYYDAVYLFFVIAGAATHGRRGGWFLSVVAGLGVLVSRLQLIVSNVVPFEPRHLADAVFYSILFVITSSAVAFLMHKTAEVVSGRQQLWTAELAARNAELAESIQLRDAMLTGVTHDLRTPLTVIKLQAQMLRRMGDQQPSSTADHIERAATRMARWIDELLEVASIRSDDEPHLALEPTDLLELIGDIVDEHAQAATRHQIVLHADVPELVGQVDAARLQRVLDNLVGNAIKYSPQGGSVRIDVSADEEWATVIVSDQGLGIPAEDLPYVFELFRRGRNVVGRISGTGIGLASAQRIVQRHDGTLDVTSTPGVGTTFTLRLPLIREPVPGPAGEPVSPHANP